MKVVVQIPQESIKAFVVADIGYGRNDFDEIVIIFVGIT